LAGRDGEELPRAAAQRSGQEHDLADVVARVRVLVPGTNEGWLDWQTDVVPTAGGALVFAAYSGTRGEAELRAAGAPVLRFPLGAREDFDVSAAGWRLCRRAEAPRQDRAYGEYVLFAPPPAAPGPLALRVSYRAGLGQEPMFFVLDRRALSADLVHAARRCGVTGNVIDGAAGVADATHNNYPEDTGRWSVSAVY